MTKKSPEWTVEQVIGQVRSLEDLLRKGEYKKSKKWLKNALHAVKQAIKDAKKARESITFVLQQADASPPHPSPVADGSTVAQFPSAGAGGLAAETPARQVNSTGNDVSPPSVQPPVTPMNTQNTKECPPPSEAGSRPKASQSATRSSAKRKRDEENLLETAKPPPNPAASLFGFGFASSKNAASTVASPNASTSAPSAPLFRSFVEHEGRVIPARLRFWAPPAAEPTKVAEGAQEAPTAVLGANESKPEGTQDEGLLGPQDLSVSFVGASHRKQGNSNPFISNIEDYTSFGVPKSFNGEIVLSAWFSVNYEQVQARPAYYGTYNTKLSNVLSFGRCTGSEMPRASAIDYDADSGDEWDEPAEGDRVEDDKDEESETSDESSSEDEKFINDDQLEFINEEDREEHAQFCREQARLKKQREQKVPPPAIIYGPFVDLPLMRHPARNKDSLHLNLPEAYSSVHKLFLDVVRSELARATEEKEPQVEHKKIHSKPHTTPSEKAPDNKTKHPHHPNRYLSGQHLQLLHDTVRALKEKCSFDLLADSLLQLPDFAGVSRMCIERTLRAFYLRQSGLWKLRPEVHDLTVVPVLVPVVRASSSPPKSDPPPSQQNLAASFTAVGAYPPPALPNVSGSTATTAEQPPQQSDTKTS